MPSSRVILRGSPVEMGTLPHPKTGVTVDEAVRKKIEEEYTDLRSPDVSPVATYLPRLTYEELRSPMLAKSSIGPGLTPRISPVVPSVSPKRGPSASSPTRHPSPVSTRVNEPPRRRRVVCVEQNGDGTYSPCEPSVKGQSHRSYGEYEEHRDDEAYYRDTQGQPDLAPSIFSRMTREERMLNLLNMCREITEITKKHPQLELDRMPDDGSVPIEEVHTYLLHARDVVSKKEKMSLLDMGIEGVYSLVAWLMERVFHVPMKAYFDNLKGKIQDYRVLIMDHTDVSTFVNSVLPSVSAPKTSLFTIGSIFFGQIIVGCIAAFIANWNGGGTGSRMAATMGATAVSDQLHNYMFTNQGIWSTILQIGKNILSKPGDAQMTGPPVDV